MAKGLYVQYGCGLSAPKEWENYDISPTLRIQKMPVLGSLLKSRLNVVFPSNVKYGDIIKGLPIPNDSCQGVYCSHTLEHLSLTDFRKALRNSYKILKKEGIFRCVVPDLEWTAKKYLKALSSGHKEASIEFINDTLLGIRKRPKGLTGFLKTYLSNAHHLWMWDHSSLATELEAAGFRDIRNCKFNDCEDKMFRLVEDKGRFMNAAALECRK